MKGKKIVAFSSRAVILHRLYIRKGAYRFNDPRHNNETISLTVSDVGGMSIQFNDLKPRMVASSDELRLATGYWLKCKMELPTEAQPTSSQKGMRNWPRSSEGRDYMESTFLTLVNYFLMNILNLSDQHNPNHHLFNSIRPLGAQDIITIGFSINGRIVAAQNNALGAQIFQEFKDDRLWPKNTRITKSFCEMPAESSLLWRASALVNYGFYREAVLIACSVIDVKLQQLIEERMLKAYHVPSKSTHAYMKNISQQRLLTAANFILMALDGTSIEKEEPDLCKKLESMNAKRNEIIHNGRDATRHDGKNAVLVAAKVLNYLNRRHKGKFIVPKCFLTDRDSAFWF